MRSAYFWRIRSASAFRFSNGCSSLNLDRIFAIVLGCDVYKVWICWYDSRKSRMFCRGASVLRRRARDALEVQKAKDLRGLSRRQLPEVAGGMVGGRQETRSSKWRRGSAASLMIGGLR